MTDTCHLIIMTINNIMSGTGDGRQIGVWFCGVYCIMENNCRWVSHVTVPTTVLLDAI